MRTKEEAAKLLLENGWKLEEVNEILGMNGGAVMQSVLVVPKSFTDLYTAWPFVPVVPPAHAPHYEPLESHIEITCAANGEGK